MTCREFVVRAAKKQQDALALDHSEAHLRSRLLLDGAVGTRYTHLISPDQELSLVQEQTLRSWLQDALQGRPIPYILGRSAFYGLDFEVNEKVLIPRPETELLVETALQLLSGHPQNRIAPRIADLGTGSGAIAVSVAHALRAAQRDAEIFALDISPSALEIAARNAARHGVSIRFLPGEGDWLLPLHPFAPFAAILSNPPYIAAAEIETLEIGVRKFEPRLALDGGSDGLNPFRAIAAGAMALLEPDGFVAVELGAEQFAQVRAVFEASGWEVAAARRDVAGIERVLVAVPTP